MKTNIRTMLIAVAALLIGNNLWGVDVVLPAGTYYFDLTGVSAKQVDVFNDLNNAKRNNNTSISMQWSDLTFDDSNPLNTGVTRNNNKTFYKSSGLSYVVVSLAYDMKIGDNYKFLQYQNMSNQDQGWRVYSQTNLTNLGTEQNKIFYCKVTSSGYEWQTSGSLPATNPTLTFTAGEGGSIDTHTAGGSNISSGATVASGTSVNLVANPTPSTNYVFLGWRDSNGSIISSMPNYVFSMPSANVSLTAVFHLDTTDPAIEGCAGCFSVAP